MTATAASEAPASASASNLDEVLRKALRGTPSDLHAHLVSVERNVPLLETATKICVYGLPVDGNGRVRFKPLAEFLRDKIIDYAIPRQAYEEALQRALDTRSSMPILQLRAKARSLFTDLANTGEGGELLLFAMAEAVFGLTQLICKMSLKTNPRVHYHGSDGVYAEARADGGLNLYWGESKVYGDAAQAVRACLESLAPFLVDPEGEDSARHRDLLLVNEYANLSSPALIEGIKRFLDKNDPASLQTVHCGIALVAFDCKAYPAGDVTAIAADIASGIRAELSGWSDRVKARLVAEKLSGFTIKFICVPLPSAEAFREYFLEVLEVKE